MNTEIKTILTCPTCGRIIPLTMISGQCPNCLLTTNFEDEFGEFSSEKAWSIPTIEELEILCPDFSDWQFIGRGGMGAVFKARQKELQREVAIKILPLEAADNRQAVERFRSEAKILAQMNHPDIVTIYDCKQNDHFYYLVMELALGDNLQTILQKKERFSLSEVIAIAQPICEALQYAHQNGIIHRDIKPENILLSKGPKIEIVDFGISGLKGKCHCINGTPAYMSPEQREGKLADSRSDIYSLALVFYQMLSGKCPIDGKLLPRTKEISPEVYEVLRKATQLDPQKRFVDMIVFFNALRNCQRFYSLTLKKIKNLFITFLGLGLLYYLIVFISKGRKSPMEDLLQNLNHIFENAQGFYILMATVGTGFFLLQLIFGHLSDADWFDSDMDGTSDVPDSGLTDNTMVTMMRFFSIRSLVTFTMFFGWGGIIWGKMGLKGLLLAFLIGLGMAMLVTWIMSLLWKLQQVNEMTSSDLIGKKGKVYLPILENKQPGGRITVCLDSCTREFCAIADKAISTGELIEIIEYIDKDCVLVKKIVD